MDALKIAAHSAAWELLQGFDVLFWDFDGVIKESVDLKTRAYGGLFESFGASVAERVRRHHEGHGGMSRLEKIPLYLGWAGVEATTENVMSYCAAFAAMVRERVIASAWVPGAREYLAEHHARQRFVLISATPEDEMKSIVQAVGMQGWFREIHGAPQEKRAVVHGVLERWACHVQRALLIGDSVADYDAACHAGITFLLRRTPLNAQLQQRHSGPQCEDFRRG